MALESDLKILARKLYELSTDPEAGCCSEQEMCSSPPPIDKEALAKKIVQLFQRDLSREKARRSYR